MLPIAIAGLGFGLSLIVSLGPQNIYVLRQGITGRHVLMIVAICTFSDVLLISAGTAGAGVVIDGRHWLVDLARFAGAGFILAYAALALRRAWAARRPQADRHPDDPALSAVTSTGLAAVVATCLAFTWLNPAVYLDTVVLLGSVASTHPGRQWWFAAGAMAASALWFGALGYGAKLLAPLFRRPRAGLWMDMFVAVVMVLTAARLLAGS